MALTFEQILEELEIIASEEPEDSNIEISVSEVIILLDGLRDHLPELFEE